MLFAIFFLALYSWKLGKGQEPFNPKYDIEYAETDPILEDEQEQLDFEQKLAEMDAAITEGLTNNSDATIKAAKDKMKKTFETTLSKEDGKVSRSKGANRRTTISYSLKDRSALALPNPVYTCDAGGKIDSALAYANQARFTTQSNKELQLGTISYNFPGQD